VRPRLFVGIGDGTGNFRARAARQLPAGGTPWFGDFDGDGKLDVAFVDGNGPNVLLGRGDGSLAEPAHFTFRDAAAPVGGVGDFDGDGAADLIGSLGRRMFMAPRACLN